MTNDHLDKETTISAEITEKGIKAGAKSRFIAALDRLAGGVLDVANAHLEAHTEKRRATTRGEVALIEAVTEYGVNQLGADPAQAERAFQRHFRKVLAQQNNAEGVLREALDDLTSNPPDEVSAANNSALAESFLDRLEGYSSTASTDDLRQRWGRVLAAEVRIPGTFSGKVLRIVDELDAETAQLFEGIATQRVGRILPKVLIGNFSFSTRSRLVLAGLLVEPGLGGQVRFFREIEDDSGTEMWAAGEEDVGLIAYPRSIGLPPTSDSNGAITNHEGRPAIPCFLLTEAGVAIATILTDRQQETMRAYAASLVRALPTPWVRIYASEKGGETLKMIDQIAGV